MNKAAIVDAVHGVLNTTKVQAEQVVDKVFDSIVAELKKGGEVSVAGLGIFSVKTRKARMAHNPQIRRSHFGPGYESSEIPRRKGTQRRS